MAVVQPTARPRSATPYVPPISAEELRARNQAAIALLESLVTEGDEQEQRETMDVLREALGERRMMSSRKLFR